MPLRLAIAVSLLALNCGGAALAEAAGDTATVKTVTYGGVTVRVPAGWPVHDLAAAPHTCIRYDRPAVYLGHPDPDQDCPAYAIGRTEAILIEPDHPVADPPDGGDSGTGGNRASSPDRAGTAAGASTAAGPKAAAAHRLAADGARMRTVTALPDQALTRRLGGMKVSVSFGADSGRAATILGSARLVAAANDDAAPDTGVTPEADTIAPDSRSADSGPMMTPATPATPAPTAAPAPEARSRTTPGAVHTRKLEPAQTFAGAGFDTCAAPSITTMATWAAKSPYKAAGIYIGGSDRACPDGNLTPGWVRQAGSQGWNLFPIYVGRQAPCWKDPGGGHPALVQHEHRWSQGVQAADDAADRAAYFGLSPASAIYFDMEYYPRHNAACTEDVQAFLGAWTAELHKRGFLSGVYSSASGGIADLAAVYNSQAAYRTDVAWFAHWDNKASLYGDPTLDDRYWPGHRRIKQYSGGHTEAFGGAQLNLDGDVLDAPVAGVR